MHKKSAGAVLLVAAAVSFSACSSSGSKSPTGSTGSSSSGSSATTRDPIKLMVIGPFAAAAYSLPQIGTGAQAAAAHLNRAGGVDGHKIEIETCNDKLDPNATLACARKAVADKVSAVVGTVVVYGNSVVSTLQAAGIPDIAPFDLNPLEHQSPDAFPVASGIVAHAGTGYVLGAYGKCTGLGVLDMSTDQSKAGGANIAAYLSHEIATLAKPKLADIPPGTSNVLAVVSDLLGGGANCLAMTNDPTTGTAAITTAQKLGFKVVTASSSGGVPAAALGALGNTANGVLTSSVYCLTAENCPAYDQFASDMKSVDPKASVDNLSANAYVGVQLAALAAQKAGGVTAADLMRGMQQLSEATTGLTPPLDFTKTSSVKGAPRTFAASMYMYKWQSGKYVLLAPKPIDVSPVLAFVG